jgi:eukaryotic-like serine/threonine-protein kinase
VAETDEAPDPLIGRTLAGKFRIERMLGAGAMGRVYLAEQTNLGKQVALKVLHASMAGDTALAKRFHREARSASMLAHPNILQIIDFGDDQGLLFIAMELLSGRDLYRAIKMQWPMPLERVGHIGSQILSALDEAHDKGVIHRDLKPENVMLLDVRGESDFVKVCDFGIAKVASERDGEGSAITVAGMVCGTPEYMSPEQARGEPLDGRSDLYAAATILYQMVAGEVPFRAESALGVITRHLTEEPIPPSKRQPNVDCPPALEALILRGLRKSREERFANAADMKHALLDAVGMRRPASSPAFARAGGGQLSDAATAATGVSTPAAMPAVAASSSPSVGARSSTGSASTAAATPSPFASQSAATAAAAATGSSNPSAPALSSSGNPAASASPGNPAASASPGNPAASASPGNGATAAAPSTRLRATIAVAAAVIVAGGAFVFLSRSKSSPPSTSTVAATPTTAAPTTAAPTPTTAAPTSPTAAPQPAAPEHAAPTPPPVPAAPAVETVAAPVANAGHAASASTATAHKAHEKHAHAVAVNETAAPTAAAQTTAAPPANAPAATSAAPAPHTFAGASAEARTLFNTGDLEGALARYQEAARLSPSDAGTQRQIAKCYNRLGQESRAVPFIKRYLELAPDASDAAFWRAQLDGK